MRELLAALPGDLPAVCLAALHVPSDRESAADEILQGTGKLKVRFAKDAEPLQHGTLLLAPPDRHLLVKDDHVRLSAGPRENFWRPSIDVLFRTTAVAHRSRVTGVIVSGTLDDGVAGLSAVRACGGEALVQDPSEALHAEMPQMALQEVEGSRALSIEAIAAEIGRIVRTEARPPPQIPAELEMEARIITDDSNFISGLAMPDRLSFYNCPECGGPLGVQHDRPLRFRCTVGHGFTRASLEQGMLRQLESSLWVAIRLLQQRATLARSLSERERQKGRTFGARTYLDRATEDTAHADVLRRLLMDINGAGENGAQRPLEQGSGGGAAEQGGPMSL